VAKILTILLRINLANLVLEMREISVTHNFQEYFSRTFQEAWEPCEKMIVTFGIDAQHMRQVYEVGCLLVEKPILMPC